MKNIVVLVRSSPMTTSRVHEACRMALGLTLSNHQVTMLYTGDGAGAAMKLDGNAIARPGLDESLDLFDACRIQEFVELDAVLPDQRAALRPHIQPLDRSGMLALIEKADRVIPW